MRFGELRSPKIIIVTCLAVMLVLAFFVKPPPPKTMTITGVVAVLENDPRTGELTALELSVAEGEAEILVNMNVDAARTGPRPVFREGQTVTLKVASPHMLAKVLVSDYLATISTGPTGTTGNTGNTGPGGP